MKTHHMRGPVALLAALALAVLPMAGAVAQPTNSGAEPSATPRPTNTGPTNTGAPSASESPSGALAPTESATPRPSPTDSEAAVDPKIDLDGVSAMKPGAIDLSFSDLTPNGDFTVELLSDSGAGTFDPPEIMNGAAGASGSATIQYMVRDRTVDGSYHFAVQDLTTGKRASSASVQVSHDAQITLNRGKFNWGDTLIAQLKGLDTGSTYTLEIRHPVTGKGLTMTDLVVADDGTSAVTVAINREDFTTTPDESGERAYGEFMVTATGSDGAILAFTATTIQVDGDGETAPTPTLSVPWLINQGAYKVLAIGGHGQTVAESNSFQVRYDIQLTADKSTYNYGDPFTLTATGFVPGETVNLVLGIPYSDGVLWAQGGMKADDTGKIVYAGTILFNQGYQYRVQDKKEYEDLVFVAENLDRSKFGVVPVSVQVAGPAPQGSDVKVQGNNTLPETGALLNGPLLGMGTALVLTGVAASLVSRHTARHG